MKQYPSIPSSLGYRGEACTAFYKYDGSNLRFEWTRKRGWHKFGTRTRLFDHTDETFGEAVEIFMNTLGEPLAETFKREKPLRSAQQIMVFCEFFGGRSFSGQHIPGDPKRLVMFDVNVHKQGLLSPVEFLDCFTHLGDKAAEMVYKGPLSAEFENLVRTSALPGLNEGVVCKGGSGHKLWMCKIKTDAYREKLKATYADKWQEFWE